MAIIEETTLAEVILKFSRTGELTERLINNRIALVKDGEVVSQGYQGAELTQEQLNDILGSSVAGLTAQVNELKDSVNNKDKTIQENTATIESLNAQITSLQAQIDALQNTPPPTTVLKLTKLQAKLVLAQFGKLDEITTAINELPISDPARIYFENATEWYRDNPILNGMAPQFDITQ